MGCLFPQAESTQRYWANIRGKVDTIREIPPTHWDPADYFDPDPKAPDRTYARRGAFLDPVDFPPLDFGIAPNNLDATDTTQLLGLLVARAALEDAGYGPGSDKVLDRDRISVILGVTGTLELVIPLGARLGHPIWRRALKAAGVADDTADVVVRHISDSYVGWQENSFPGLLGNVTAGRIANRLDLGGTNCVIDAACASSLAAVHLAMLELAARRCDMVLTGGLDTFNDIFMYMCFSKTPALSPTGDARPFDAQGDGTILGEGLGILALKRLDDARRDGDTIYAVIRAIGTSSDGKGNAIYAPSAPGQAKALRRAYALAGFSPETVELVEAHGTGTRVGDAVEVSALSSVFREARPDGAWCALGSVKSQIGHTKAAAGVAGLIKAAMALHHKVLPPTIKVDTPIDEITASRSPFYLNTEARPWVSHSEHPRRAGLSAFGFGGSNYHCVLEESEQTMKQPDWDGEHQILAFSAQDNRSLAEQLERWTPPRKWSELRVAADALRRSFRSTAHARLTLVVRPDDIEATLRAARARLLGDHDGQARRRDTPGAPLDIFRGEGPRPGTLAFVFPGQGSQSVGMLRDLICRFPVAFESFDSHGRLEDSTQRHLADWIYPASDFSVGAAERQAQALRATEIAQPAIGAVSWAGYRLLRGFGIEPECVAGHSFGELTALAAAGVYSESSLAKLARARGRLMATCRGDRGGMLALFASSEQIETLILERSIDVVVANKNSRSQVVVSGPTQEIIRLMGISQEAGIATKLLDVAAAFHSPFVAEVEAPFRSILQSVEWKAPAVPVFANSTGARYPHDRDAARDLLAGQITRPVEFIRMIKSMHEAGTRTFVEVGPDCKLTGLIRSILEGQSYQAIALDASCRQPWGLENIRDLARVLAHLGALGYPVHLALWDPQEAAQHSKAPRSPGKTMTVPVCGAHPSPKRKTQSPTEPRSSPPLVPRNLETASRTQADPVVKTPSAGAVVELQAIAPVVPTEVTKEPDPSAARPRNPRDTESVETPRDRGVSVVGDPSNSMATTSRITPTDPKQPPFSATHSMNSDLLQRWIQESQANLNALQAFQERTAELHRKFLEGQAQLQQGFQSLLEHHHQLLAQSVNGRPIVAPVSSWSKAPAGHESVAQPHPVPVSVPIPVPVLERESHRPDNSALLHDDHSDHELESTEYLTERSVGEQQQEQDQEISVASFSSKAQTTLIEIVAEKTGYPIEMLEPTMQLDADLGIDSIKRVEILSAVQERLPGAPEVKPEHLGSLQTLMDIIEFLNQGAAVVDGTATAASPVRAASAVAPRAGSDSDSDSSAARLLLCVVADKTGYPAEMLDLDMQLDADLGIDSIKRVEILSAVQEQVPDAPEVKPEHLGGFQTLRDVLKFLEKPLVLDEQAQPSASASLRAPVEARREPSKPSVENRGDGRVPLSDDSGLHQDSLRRLLLGVVAEKTGYPVEMLDPSMSLDHDLGIDSIKRVEILSSLQEQLPGVPEVRPEDLGRLDTLESIVILLSGSPGGRQSLAQVAELEPIPTETVPAPTTESATILSTASLVVRLPRAVLLGEIAHQRRELRTGSRLGILCDDPRLVSALRQSWETAGIRLHTLAAESPPDSAQLSGLDGLLLVAPSAGTTTTWLRSAFLWTREAGRAWKGRTADQRPLLVGVSRLDGRFGYGHVHGHGHQGIDSAFQFDAISGGLAGLIKCASMEWPEVDCKVIDVDPRLLDSDLSGVARRLVDEASIEGPIEVGLGREGRYGIKFEKPSTLSRGSARTAPPLNSHDVVIITGGARGITAEVAFELASAVRPTLVVLGRTPEPGPEPDWLRPLKEEGEIKRALAQQLNGHTTPRKLTEQTQTLLAQRETRRNLERIASTGARVIYRSVDLRDARALSNTLDAIRGELGPIRGLIHGAGVLADRMILDQTEEQFDLVVSTKVEGLESLLRNLDDDLACLVLFSSSTARFGRAGQVSYAIANEVLNKIACREARRAHLPRVLSINWGPWEGGMVTPALQAIFAREGIGLIPLQTGARWLIEQMSGTTADRDSAVELVVLGPGSQLPQPGPMHADSVLGNGHEHGAPAQENRPSSSSYSLVFERRIDLVSVPVLSSHVIDGRAVVPVVLFMEYLAQGALQRNPGLFFRGIEGFRLLKGVVIKDGAGTTLQIVATKPSREGEVFRVRVEARSLSHDGRTIPHARADILLSERLRADQPRLDLSKVPEWSMDLEDIYASILFHGPEMRAIERVEQRGADGVSAWVATSPPPSAWLEKPVRPNWASDPLAIDAAFQLVVLWCHARFGAVSLPTSFARYEQFRRSYPREAIQVKAKLIELGPNRAVMEIEFLDEVGVVLARMEQYECVVDPKLNQAFRRNQLTAAARVASSRK